MFISHTFHITSPSNSEADSDSEYRFIKSDFRQTYHFKNAHLLLRLLINM